MAKSLFNDSLDNHQYFLDVLLRFKDSDGICKVTQTELMEATGRGWTWITKAINRLNTEDTCVEKIAKSQYIVHYEDLRTNGIYSLIFKMMCDSYENPDIIRKSDFSIMDTYHCSRKTVQMYRAYMLSGWHEAMAKSIESGEILAQDIIDRT